MSIRAKYHHGNLRQALMDAAVVSIRDQGAAKLSLRALAREVGVSQAAPYRHFADKAALFSALASDGSARLAAAMKEVMGDIEHDPVGAFQRGGQAYVEFAQQNPETYRLMYSMRVEEFAANMNDDCHGEALQLLEQTLDAGLASGAFKPHHKDALLLASWSMVHGYAQLVIDGIIELDGMPCEKQFRAVTMVMNQGVVAD
ncbi:MAG: AcrR family transcriptional regulator [Paraglaciecola sp.]|jgi:AcrR family transcriptional regulator